MAKIGFIGMGNMGYAMLKGIINKFDKDDIIFTDVNYIVLSFVNYISSVIQ